MYALLVLYNHFSGSLNYPIYFVEWGLFGTFVKLKITFEASFDVHLVFNPLSHLGRVVQSPIKLTQG